MQRIAAIILGFCLMLALPARADQWSKSFSLTGKPDLTVTTSDANIQVDTWDQNRIEAEVTSEGRKIGVGGVKVVDRQAGDSIELEVRMPHEVCIVCFHSKSHHVDVQIHMPREGRVNLHTGDGHIRLKGVKGDMDLLSGDGNRWF